MQPSNLSSITTSRCTANEGYSPISLANHMLLKNPTSQLKPAPQLAITSVLAPVLMKILFSLFNILLIFSHILAQLCTPLL